jgi:SEC-C motif-containing protein
MDVSDLMCPCDSGKPYTGCCGLLHESFARDGRLAARSADALMRSRYSAFVRDLRPYLLASWHPRTRPAQLDAPEPGLRWLGLELKRHELLDETHALVAFVARSKLGGRAHRLVETSRFERINGEWFYVDGAID